MDDSFYIVLPSNTSSEYFPNNTTTRFTTRLPRSLRLSGRWAVGLTDIQFPQTFLHLSKDADRNFTELRHMKQETVNNRTIIKQWVVKSKATPGIYRSIEDFVKAINLSRPFKDHLKFAYAPENGGYVQVIQTCDSTTCAVHFFTLSREIAYTLGFTQDLLFPLETEVPVLADQPACLASGLPNLFFIYSDICEPYITGGAQTPLLQVVPVDVDSYVYGKIRTKSFSPPKYIPLLNTNFETIEIDIRDQFGRPIPFESGTLTVTLHFKKLYDGSLHYAL